MRILFFLIIAVVTVFCLFSMTGCASVSPTFDDKGKVIGGSSFGFFRDMELDQTIKPDGSSRMIIKSKSNTSDVMRAGNEILGTAAGIAGQAMS